MASSLLNKLKLIAGESIDTTDPTDPNSSNQAIIDRYKNVPGVNVEKLTEYVNLNIPEPQTIVDAMLLAEAIGYTPEQAKVVGAQWAVESGRGVNTAGADYNYFGVKSHNDAVMKRMSEQYGIDVSQGDVVKTVEYINGERKVIESTFASFNNPIEGFLGKKAFLETNKRYKKALNPENTADEFAQGLKDAGYATDPVYASKLAKIYNGKMRTTRPSWMEPTRKSNVSQKEWTMTTVQPTEDSRADLVAESPKKPFFTINPVEEEELILNPFTGEKKAESDPILDDIKYNPRIPKMIGNTEEDINNYLANKKNVEDIALAQLAEEEQKNYQSSTDNYEKLAAANAANEQIFPEIKVVAKKPKNKKDEIIPLQKPVEEEKIIDMEYLNNIPDVNSFISPGSFTNESRSKEELKQAAEAENFIMSPLKKNAGSGYFGSGQSLFYPSTRRQKNGGAMASIIPTYYKSKGTPIYRDTTALPFETGGYTVTRSNERKGKTHKVVRNSDGKTEYYGYPGMGEKGNSKLGKEAFRSRHAKNLKNNPFFRAYANATWKYGGSTNKKYFDNGGSEDKISKPTNPINTSKGLFSMLGDIARYDAARKMSKTELPKKEEGMTNYDYFNSLNKKQLASIPYKEQMNKRDVEAENYHVNQVKDNMLKIASDLEGMNMKEDYEYLGVPWMGQQNIKQIGNDLNEDVTIIDDTSSWFHKIPSPYYTGYQNEAGEDVLSPYTCIGAYCAIGAKAGARMTEDNKYGKAGDPWKVITGNYIVDDPKIEKSMGLYPKNAEDMEPGDVVRQGYNTNVGTGHTMLITGDVIKEGYDEGKYPTTYGSGWNRGVFSDTWARIDDAKGIKNPNKTDQILGYKGRLPAMKENLTKSENLNAKYQEYLDQKAIAKMPLKKAELTRTGPVKMPFISRKEYPNTRRGRKQEQQDNAYIEAYMARMQKK